MEIITFMEYFTLAVTLFMFATGIPPCIEMWKSGSTKNIPYALFLLSVISCAGMVHYGLILGVGSLVFINGVGFVLNGIYTLLYLAVSKEKLQSFGYLVAAIAYTVGLYYYMFANTATPDDMAAILGKSSSSITTILVCLPILEIISNIRYQNADGSPLIMLLGGGACGLCWLVYGLMLNDPNIYSPNIPGLSILAVKLACVAIFSGNEEKIKTS